MSRFDFRCPVDTSLTFAFGVDHVCGPFLQVLNSEDEAIFGIDNQGVNSDCLEDIENLSKFVPGLISLVDETKLRFTYSRGIGIPYPNLDAETICKFARKFGLDIDEQIYKALD